jgi:hypothetical protein
MPEHISNLNIQNDIFQLLDKVIKTGVPAEIERKGKRGAFSISRKLLRGQGCKKMQDF